ncbi:hypothetical protein [Nostoc sp.]|uniref:hypothetical protein n=1 Tax=Nostoc sp. TaxID=1180 RepID=UPI003FA5BBD9
MGIGNWGASAVGGFPDLRRLASLGISQESIVLFPLLPCFFLSPQPPAYAPCPNMFLYLSKLLPLFFYPLGLACVSLVVALVTLWKRPFTAAIASDFPASRN